ncbi:hypothetical protein D3C74_399130 [compost metagenome]
MSDPVFGQVFYRADTVFLLEQSDEMPFAGTCLACQHTDGELFAVVLLYICLDPLHHSVCIAQLQLADIAQQTIQQLIESALGMQPLQGVYVSHGSGNGLTMFAVSNS